MQVYSQTFLLGKRTQSRNCSCANVPYWKYIYRLYVLVAQIISSFSFHFLFEKLRFAHRTQFCSLWYSMWVLGVSSSSGFPFPELQTHTCGTRTVCFSTVSGNQDLTVPAKRGSPCSKPGGRSDTDMTKHGITSHLCLPSSIASPA